MGKRKLLILGCGWAGKITASLFLENDFEVWGTTTQEHKRNELKELGIHPILLDFTKENNFDKELAELQSHTFDLILISVPVRRNEETDSCLSKFENLAAFVAKQKAQQIIYLSSIGVYEPVNGSITEESEVNESGNIFLIEQTLKKSIKDLVILRLGGLFGFGRIPGRYFSNKVCTVGQEKANYIHGTDVAYSILGIWEKGISKETFNVVAPIHPLKEAIYEKMATKYNFLPVLYSDGITIQKEVSSNKLVEELDFKFRKPSPLDF
jgi:nucleoside-diphosphate-sugar epimerase